jgi:hypothetical protein
MRLFALNRRQIFTNPAKAATVPPFLCPHEIMTPGTKPALVRLALFAVFVLAVVTFCGSAKADVCTSANCATKKPLSQMVGTDPVLWCDAQAKEFECSKVETTTWSNTSDFTQVRTDGGYFRKDQIPTTTAPPVTPFVYEPPKCFNFLDARWKWELTSFKAAIWCEHNDGIKWSGRMYDLTQTVNRRTETPVTEANVLDLDKKLTTRALSAAEFAELDAYALTFAPTAKVINSTVDGVIVGPPKYARTATGTLGKSVGRATKDQACYPWSRLVDATGKGTSYYRLIGEEYYARCNVTGRYVKL